MSSPTAENLHQTIAKNLRELRRARGLTLDETAESTGVSKSMLGQIERGECGLSVATLWKISTGLRISFTSLMKEDTPGVEIIEDKSLQPIISDTDGFRLYPLFPVEADRAFEIVYIEIDPGVKSCSEPHDHGTEEFVMVCDGTLTLKLENGSWNVPAGHSIRYQADQRHCYANETEAAVRLYMIIRYADVLA